MWTGGHIPVRVVNVTWTDLNESEEAMEREPSARRYIWATLFLGDINMGAWPSRLGESQELGQ
jgi:hypothetical protein